MQIGNVVKLKSGESGKIVAITSPGSKNPFLAKWDYIIELENGQSLKIVESQIEEESES